MAGASGAVVKITLHLYARGAVPREGIEVRFPKKNDRFYRPPYSSVSMETPVLPQKAESALEGETGGNCEQSFVTTADAGEAFMAARGDSVVALDSGATANLVRVSWPAHHNRILERRGVPKETTCSAQARFRFRDGRLGEVRQAANIPGGIAGNKGMFTWE